MARATTTIVEEQNDNQASHRQCDVCGELSIIENDWSLRLRAIIRWCWTRTSDSDDDMCDT